MKLFKFNDKDNTIYNLENIISIRKEFDKIFVTTIKNVDTLSYNDNNLIIKDIERIEIFTNMNTEVVLNNVKSNLDKGIDNIKNTLKETTSNIARTPTAFFFTSDFNGMLEKYKAGSTANVKYINGYYYVVNNFDTILFKASDEGRQYGYLMYGGDQ